MGLKDWFGKNVSGPSGYGRVMGREAAKNGIALGRILYLGHGTRGTASGGFVFDDSDEMISASFDLYCTDQMHQPPMEDSSELSKHTRAAGITFAATCSIVAAFSCMAEAKAGMFSESMGDVTPAELHRLNPGITRDLLTHYNLLPRPVEITRVLNPENPGNGDLLALFLEEVGKQSRGRAVGFQRRGALGFETIAVSLAQETMRVIQAAAQKFGW